MTKLYDFDDWLRGIARNERPEEAQEFHKWLGPERCAAVADFVQALVRDWHALESRRRGWNGPVETPDGGSDIVIPMEILIPTEATLEDVETAVDRVEDEIAMRLQTVLNGMEGMEFSSFVRRRRIADRIHAVVKRIHRKLLCPTCELPGRFRAVRAPRVETGVFRFDHGNTTHSVGTTLPKLRISE